MIPYPCWLPSASAVRIRKVASCIARIAIPTLYIVELAVASPPSPEEPARCRSGPVGCGPLVHRVRAASSHWPHWPLENPGFAAGGCCGLLSGRAGPKSVCTRADMLPLSKLFWLRNESFGGRHDTAGTADHLSAAGAGWGRYAHRVLDPGPGMV